VKCEASRSSPAGSTIDDGGVAEASPAVTPVKNPQISSSWGVLMLFSESRLTPDDYRLSAVLALNRSCAARVIGLGAGYCASFELLSVYDRGLLVSLLHGSPWMELLSGLAAKDCRYTVH